MAEEGEHTQAVWGGGRAGIEQGRAQRQGSGMDLGLALALELELEVELGLGRLGSANASI